MKEAEYLVLGNDMMHIKLELAELQVKVAKANVTERVLFPGLGGLSRWLKRHYSSKC